VTKYREQNSLNASNFPWRISIALVNLFWQRARCCIWMALTQRPALQNNQLQIDIYSRLLRDRRSLQAGVGHLIGPQWRNNVYLPNNADRWLSNHYSLRHLSIILRLTREDIQKTKAIKIYRDCRHHLSIRHVIRKAMSVREWTAHLTTSSSLHRVHLPFWNPLLIPVNSPKYRLK
jgi:hypothetical protein